MDLSRIYDWARERDYRIEGEHIWIHGVAVQFLAAKDGLETEAIERARSLAYDGVAVRVMAPEYLVLLYTLTGGSKRRTRAHDLVDAAAIDFQELQEIIKRHNLTDEWQRKWHDERD